MPKAASHHAVRVSKKVNPDDFLAKNAVHQTSSSSASGGKQPPPRPNVWGFLQKPHGGVAGSTESQARSTIYEVHRRQHRNHAAARPATPTPHTTSHSPAGGSAAAHASMLSALLASSSLRTDITSPSTTLLSPDTGHRAHPTPGVAVVKRLRETSRETARSADAWDRQQQQHHRSIPSSTLPSAGCRGAVGGVGVGVADAGQPPSSPFILRQNQFVEMPHPLLRGRGAFGGDPSASASGTPARLIFKAEQQLDSSAGGSGIITAAAASFAEAAARESPRPAMPLGGGPVPHVEMPPYVAPPEESPLGLPAAVGNGFDKLCHSIDSVVSHLPESSLDARLVRVGKWLERFQEEQQPGAVVSQLLPLLNAARRDTASMVVPNISMLAASSSVLHQTLLLLNRMYPDFAQVSIPAFQIMLKSVFFVDPFEEASRGSHDTNSNSPPCLFTESEDPAEVLRGSVMFFSGKTYFQALRDVSKRLGQAVMHFEQQTQEREKLCSALNKIISVWQLMYTGSLFRAWRGVHHQRVKYEQSEEVLKDIEQEKKKIELKQKRNDVAVDEIKKEKNKEIQILREGIKKAEDDLHVVKEANRSLTEKLRGTEERLKEFTERAEELSQMLDKQRRDADLKYANLACRTMKLISRTQPPRFELDRLESHWGKFYSPDDADTHHAFAALSPLGQPDKIIEWVNRISLSHPLADQCGAAPVRSLEGSPQLSRNLLCALGVMSPGHVVVSQHLRTLTDAEPGEWAQRVADALPAMRIPPLATACDIGEGRSGSGVKNLLLCTYLHWRFLSPSTGTLAGGVEFFDPSIDGDAPGLSSNTWEEYDSKEPPYSEDHPVPEVVRKYVKVSPSAMTTCYEVARARVEVFENRALITSQALLGSLAHMISESRFSHPTGGENPEAALAEMDSFIGLDYDTIFASEGTPLGGISRPDFLELEGLLKRHFRQLRQIYMHYGGGSRPPTGTGTSAASTHSSFTSSGGGGYAAELHFEDLWKLVVDCGLDQKAEGLDRSGLREVFGQSRRVESGSAERVGAGGAALSPREFIYSVVLTALARFQHRQGAMGGVAVKTAHLLDNYILPEASYVDSSVVRSYSDDGLSRKVLQKRRADIAKLYRHYSNKDGSSGQGMSSKEFMIFCSEAKITDDFCTAGSVGQVFRSVSEVFPNERGGGGGMSPHAGVRREVLGLDILGFTTGLCVLSAHKYPSPLVPLHLRVQRLWQSTVIANLQKKLKLTDGAEFDVEPAAAAPAPSATLAPGGSPTLEAAPQDGG